MSKSIYIISIQGLVISLIPLVLVCIIYLRWFGDVKKLIYATIRMLLQLSLVGFVLGYIFKAESYIINLLILLFMLLMASWIALYPTRQIRRELFKYALISLIFSCIPTLLLIVFFVIKLKPWFQTTYLIPLAGMIFANSMNSISLANERYHKERQRNESINESRKISFEASMIPIVNSFFAVGLVSLPGMMTGQILAGISPLIASRYQIMVMAMVFGSTGIASSTYLILVSRNK